MSSVATKLNVTGTGGDALDRFCDLYNLRSGGKSALVNDLLAGGLVLKETGLLDLVLNLDNDLDYRNAKNTDKTRLLIAELADLFGHAKQATLPPAAPEPTAKEQAQEPTAKEQVQEPTAKEQAQEPERKKVTVRSSNNVPKNFSC